MKKKHADERKRKRKLKPPRDALLHLQGSDTNSIFALLLASLSKLHRPLTIKCLLTIRPSLLSQSSFTPILSLLPALLTSKSSQIACRAANIVGAASLLSLEVNEQVASDSETLKGLISLLESPKRKVLLSACNAVLDLSATSFAQRQLLKFSALEKLMFVFLQIFKCVESVSLWSEGNQSFGSLKIGIKEDEVSAGFVSATVILINSCEVERLQSIPRSLSEAFLRLLKGLWTKVSDQVVLKAAVKYNEGGYLCKSNIGVSNLAEAIFRLSAIACRLTVSMPFEVVNAGLFGTSDSSFEDFLSNYWEVSPFLLQGTVNDPCFYNMFSSFIKSLSWTGYVPSLISSILHGLVSCFPIASDELSIFNFLNEVKDRLGCPIIYKQDIRVVKAEWQSRKEMHYFQDFHPGSIKEPQYFTIDDVLKCVQAYEEGYTIALRGLEFRFQSIAAVAETLALMFGLPSVGANLYLTPPNSQGLACHYDDHCVFVCQIFGSKQWTVFSQSSQLLPRLYDDLNDSDIDCTKAGKKEFFLREGDVLYIPRVDKVRTESRFLEVLNSIEVAVHKNEDPFQQIRWLWVHLENGTIDVYKNRSSMIEDMLSLRDHRKDELETAFVKVISRFCSEVVFEDVVTSHMMLLRKYRNIRKQYVDGISYKPCGMS
ncbi:hypothetical protein PIB30_008190 [Stylosanthes scabra]|uniref:Bifunctional lysine-specific demethylase and histidyl-hydroxylase n=1 Tax=Stylosanthes scabra TaxID=79078 RepID=A0ABU6Z2P3_9FABA|nr:hypothetical protein [Stylosanthes scabra]